MGEKRRPAEEKAQGLALGGQAYLSELGRIARSLPLDEKSPELAAVVRRVSQAREVAARGDYIRAIHVLGSVVVTSDSSPPRGLAPRADDVEQALGDLKRAIAKAPESAARQQAMTLCRAARMEASELRWSAAWALVDEASQRLAAEWHSGAPP